MYEKAVFFGDHDMARKILMLKDPAQIKKAGRLVKGFDDKLWSPVKVVIMDEVISRKAENTSFGEYLDNTQGVIFVEASPYDRVWGIGLSRYDAIRTQESLWPGKNLLGKIVNHVQYNRNFWKSVNG